MKLILQKDVKNLGKAGDQVNVKKGYARNFLIPKGHAFLLDESRLKLWKHQKVIIEAKKRKAISERKAVIEKLASIKLNFEKESQKDGRLFGSVTAFEISQALEKLHQLSVDKRDINASVLKTAGDHTVTITLDSENKTDITVSIKGKITKKKDSEDSSDEKADKKPSFLEKAKMALSLGRKSEEEGEEKESDTKQATNVEENKETEEATKESTSDTKEDSDSSETKTES